MNVPMFAVNTLVSDTFTTSLLYVMLLRMASPVTVMVLRLALTPEKFLALRVPSSLRRGIVCSYNITIYFFIEKY